MEVADLRDSHPTPRLAPGIYNLIVWLTYIFISKSRHVNSSLIKCLKTSQIGRETKL